jgi:hypothetical protein
MDKGGMKMKRFTGILTAIIIAVSIFSVPVFAQDTTNDVLPFYASGYSSTDLHRYKEWRSVIINCQPTFTIYSLASQADVDFIMKSMGMFIIYDPLTSHVKDIDVALVGNDAVISMTYKMSKNEYDEAMKAADEAYTELSKTFGEDDNTALKVKKTHDFLADKVNYSIEAKGSDNLYGTFIGGLAKCDGYAKSFSYLLTKAGIDNAVAIGETRDPEDDTGHAWNKVKIGKSWYIIDVTNDDTTENIDFVVYDYFMISDDEYAAEFIQRDDPYVAEPVADNEKNSYYKQKKLVADDALTAVNIIQTQAKSADAVPFMMTVQLTSTKEYKKFVEMINRDTTLFTNYIPLGGRTLSAFSLRNEENLIMHIIVKQLKGYDDNMPYGT